LASASPARMFWSVNVPVGEGRVGSIMGKCNGLASWRKNNLMSMSGRGCGEDEWDKQIPGKSTRE
jgi:hypothetical protein